MKRLSILPLALFGFGCGSSVEIPSLSIGRGGARFMTDAKTPYEAYDKAYTELGKLHLNIRRNLNPDGNRLGVTEAAERIVHNLETMKTLLVAPPPSDLNPYIAFYKEVLRLAERNMLGGTWGTMIDKKESQLRSRYHPSGVEITANVPTREANELPLPVERKEDRERTKGETVSEPSASKNSDAAAYRLMYKAWRKCHDDLYEAFGAKKEVRERFEELREALRELEKRLGSKQAERLRVYIQWYEKIHDDTKGFTVLPDGAKDEDILNDLKIAAAGMERDFDPARKR